MVTLSPAYLIDTTFIFKRISETFNDTPLFVNNNGQNHTRLYGFLRDLLRLYASLSINYGVLIIGKENYSVAQREDIDRVVGVIRTMKIPFVLLPSQNILNICSNLSSHFTHLVCDSKCLLQFANDDLKIVMRCEKENYIEMSAVDIYSKYGVKPNEMPTLLALTGISGKRTAKIDLTERQAIKLIDSYSYLERVFGNLSQISNNTIRDKLYMNRKIFFSRYSKLLRNKTENVSSYTLDTCKWNLVNEKNKYLLQSYGFFSLQPLLAHPK